MFVIKSLLATTPPSSQPPPHHRNETYNTKFKLTMATTTVTLMIALMIITPTIIGVRTHHIE